ncbi:MAG: hypothetical protein ACI8T1_002778 [Verrucomicrobiales bacterium]|jgi:hypothetical protein
MSSFTHYNPSFHLQKVETIETADATEIVFFDQKIDFVPPGAQLLLGVFVDPSGEGHLEELEGVSVQIDSNSGIVLDTLRKGQPAGKLDTGLSGRTNVRLSIHIEKHGRVFLPHLSISDVSGAIGGVNLDWPWPKRDLEKLILPAFYAPSEIQLSAFCGYYSEDLYHPEFGDQQVCVWPDDVMKPQG